jgi:hypothetical protein
MFRVVFLVTFGARVAATLASFLLTQCGRPWSVFAGSMCLEVPQRRCQLQESCKPMYEDIEGQGVGCGRDVNGCNLVSCA